MKVVSETGHRKYGSGVTKMNSRNRMITCCVVVAVCVTAIGVAGPFQDRRRQTSPRGSATRPQVSNAEPVVTSSEQYPPGPLGDVVRLGETLVRETHAHPLTRPFVGNRLNCTSCHLDAGTHSQAASFIGVAAAYPAYSPRESGVITLEDRILNCFIRSQNGTRPPHGGTVSVAIAAYITWLSQGTKIAMNASEPLGPNRITMLNSPKDQPDIGRGALLYANRCADCHAADGSGNESGPPVWGEGSYNDGAGLTKVAKLASWLKVAMPLDDATLTEQEAYDIAAFVNSHARPRFRPK